MRVVQLQHVIGAGCGWHHRGKGARHRMAEGLASGTRTMSNVTMAWKDTPKEWEADMREARKFSQSSSVASFCLVSPDMYGPYLRGNIRHNQCVSEGGGGGGVQHSASILSARPPVTCLADSRSRHFSALTSYT